MTILLLLWSKITLDLVNFPDLVNFLLLTKKFTKSGVYCTFIKIAFKRIIYVFHILDFEIEMFAVNLSFLNSHSLTPWKTDTF